LGTIFVLVSMSPLTKYFFSKKDKVIS
jgi:hypothetical protein